MSKEFVAILDFGSQYNQLIARRVRECNVYSEILPHDIAPDELKQLNPRGIILSGGPSSVFDRTAPRCHKDVFGLGIPVLGICYGMQLMGQMLAGEVARGKVGEYGSATLQVTDDSDLFSELPATLGVWMSHGDRVISLPQGFEVIGRTDDCPIAAMRHGGEKFFAVQFHPEVTHTPRGKDILHNFLFKVCGCAGDWTMASFVQHAIHDIRETVGNDRVICALSGGVDSSVTAALIHRAIGDRLDCIFVNNALMRQGEPEQVLTVFRDHIHLNLHYVDASDRFLRRLEGVTDPEEKRKIIGDEFIRVFTDKARELGEIRFLAQGTLYPDVIESRAPRGAPSATIKSHHNVGGLPDDMHFELIEPLRELFKDEVRKLAAELALPEVILRRQPFPGPGLAVRIIGEVTPERLDVLRQVDVRVQEEMRRYEGYADIWQSFAILLPTRSVGVMGDERTYENTAVLRVVTSKDGMTADWARLPYDLLDRISRRIVNEVSGVNRVAYDISSKPPSTIEWE